MATIETEGKSIAEALQKALTELQCQKDEIEYVVLQQPSAGFLGLFGGKPARLRVMRKAAAQPAEKSATAQATTHSESAPAAEAAANEAAKAEPTAEEQAQRAEQFLHNVMVAMDVPVRIERSESEEGTVFNLIGEDLGILIGKHGQTLDSLQYLANLAANRGIDGERHHIVLDIENYRARREETLKTLAEHLAEKACRIHRDVRLEPMNRHERKIIHTALQDSERVTTRSEGDEPRRYVVIAPRRQRTRQQAAE